MSIQRTNPECEYSEEGQTGMACGIKTYTSILILLMLAS